MDATSFSSSVQRLRDKQCSWGPAVPTLSTISPRVAYAAHGAREGCRIIRVAQRGRGGLIAIETHSHRRPPRGGTRRSRSTDGCSNFCNELSRGCSLGRGIDRAQPGIDRAIRNAGIDRAHQRTPYRSWVHPDVSSSEAHFLASLVNVTSVAYVRSSEAPLSLVILVVMLFSLRSNTITPKGIHNYPPKPPLRTALPSELTVNAVRSRFTPREATTLPEHGRFTASRPGRG